jgi:hypothetical protein
MGRSRDRGLIWELVSGIVAVALAAPAGRLAGVHLQSGPGPRFAAADEIISSITGAISAVGLR